MKNLRILAAIIAILYTAAFSPAFSSELHNHENCYHKHSHHDQCNHESCSHEGCTHEHCNHEHCNHEGCTHEHHHEDLGTGENAEFGREIHHDHDNCMSCNEYFNAAWRLPETVVFMRKYSINLITIIIIISFFRIFRVSRKKTKKEAIDNE